MICNDSESGSGNTSASGLYSGSADDSESGSGDTSASGRYSGSANDSESGSGDTSSGSGGSGPCPTSTSDYQECLPHCYVCGGSASVERVFITGFTVWPDQPLESCNPNSCDTFAVTTEQKQHNITMNEECDEDEPYL